MFDKYERVYFLGIGGIGMSAIAEYFHANGRVVAGYDRVRNVNCRRLEGMSIAVHYDDIASNIPLEFRQQATTLVVYTPAIPADSEELNYFKLNGFDVMKRAEVLGMICNKKRSIAVAGSHGKTSVSGICANIMSVSERGCSAFLGGIAKNFDSNLHIDTGSDVMVVEADEFDRSFLHLTPSTAVITYIEPDHLDIYGSYDNLQEAFVIFANKTHDDGNVLLNKNVFDKIHNAIKPSLHVYTYSVDESAVDFFVSDVVYANGLCTFNINHAGRQVHVGYHLGGRHNIENALVAAAAAMLNGASDNDVKLGLETFAGIVRRFDFIVNNDKHIYIDDYAHHPSEIHACLSAVRKLFPHKSLTAVFQPHLYSRTADLHHEFAASLANCDHLIVLPIYPARELPIKGISSQLIIDEATNKHKMLVEKHELVNTLQNNLTDIIVTMGAGDIDALVRPIANMLNTL